MAMQIQINFSNDVPSTDALYDATMSAVQKSMERFEDRVTRVEVHLHDQNGPKHGSRDKKVTMEARIAGQQPLAVDEENEDMYKAINGAAGKLQRAVGHKLERLAES